MSAAPSSSPRVVYLADSTADVRMIEGFAERFDLVLVAPRALGPRVATGPVPAGVEQVLLPGGRGAFLIRAWRWLVAGRRRYDLVVVLDNTRAGLVANLAGLVARRPVIIQLGRPTEEYFRCRRLAGARGARFRAGLLAVRAVVALNERLAAGIGATSAYVAAQSRRRNRRVVAIPAYGIDAEAFAPRLSPEEARRALGLAATGALVLFRSRLAPEKDPETFLRAVALLRDEGRALTALYVGAEHRHFAEMAARMGVPVIGRDHMHPLRELPLYYRAASVTVQTSHAEGLGISPLESLACEVPAVVTAVGGLTEVASGGEAAVLVPPRDSRRTAAAIAWVLDHPDLARAMARRGRELVLSGYTTRHAFDAWERLAAEVLGRKAPRPAEAPLR